MQDVSLEVTRFPIPLCPVCVPLNTVRHFISRLRIDHIKKELKRLLEILFVVELLYKSSGTYFSWYDFVFYNFDFSNTLNKDCIRRLFKSNVHLDF